MGNHHFIRRCRKSPMPSSSTVDMDLTTPTKDLTLGYQSTTLKSTNDWGPPSVTNFCQPLAWIEGICSSRSHYLLGRETLFRELGGDGRGDLSADGVWATDLGAGQFGDGSDTAHSVTRAAEQPGPPVYRSPEPAGFLRQPPVIGDSAKLPTHSVPE